MQYPEFKCSKCKKTFFDEDKAGAERGICGICRGKIQCEECTEWTEKINKEGLCDKCIPRYVKYSSISEAMGYEVLHDFYNGVTPDDKINFLVGVIEEILTKLPRSIREEVLTYKKHKNENTRIEKFIKEEDRIE